MRGIRTFGARFVAACLVAALGGCFHPPNTATPDDPAASVSDAALTNETPLGLVIKESGIAPLDPASRTPLLEQAAAALAKSDKDGRYRGVTYDLTDGNVLAPDWVIQSPAMWGRSAASLAALPVDCDHCDADFHLPSCRRDADCPGAGEHCGTLQSFASRPGQARKRRCLGQADHLVDRWYTDIVRARATVDIATLAPAPDARFLAALRNAITRLAYSHRPVVVRILVGQYPPDDVDAKRMVEDLVRDARTVKHSHVTVYGSAMRSCTASPACSSFSWNHAKLLSIDGKEALVGGHNLRSLDYLDADPIHDISMALAGPAASDADRFADRLWGFVCNKAGNDPIVASYVYKAGAASVEPGCLAQTPLPQAAPGAAGGVPVLAVGRLASGITTDFANQSELARDLLLGSARRTMLIAQQDIGFRLSGVIPDLPGIPGLTYPTGITYPETTLEHIADFMLGGGDTYIVLSNDDAMGLSGSSYSNDVPVDDVARKIQSVAKDRSKLSDAALTDLLCRHLHIAPFRFGADAAWPDGKPIGNHGKFWMIDDHVFYIGSDNMYPSDLQEFGYIIDDAVAAATLRRTYWDRLWTWSRAAAISGADAPACLFRDAAS